MSETTYITANKAAEMLECSPGTVRKMLRSGGLRGEKVGGAWRIALPLLAQFTSPAGAFHDDPKSGRRVYLAER